MAKKSAPAKPAPLQPVRHPIKAATLLYSAPPAVLRGPIYMMFVVMISMFAYSIVATKDVLVVAPLKLQRQSVTVQAVSGGIVESLDAVENTQVAPGSPLATIQEKIRAASTPEQEALDKERGGVLERRDELLRDYSFRRQQMESQRIDTERRLATTEGGLRNRIGQLENQLETARQTKRNFEADLVTARAASARLEPLCARRDVPITQCEAARQQASNVQRAVTSADAETRNIELSLRTARDELAQQMDQRTLDRLIADLGKLEDDHKNLMENVDARLQDIDERRNLAATLVPGVRPGRRVDDRDKVYYTSVVDGIVTTAHIQRAQLVSPGAALFTIVRNTAPLEARVLIPNQDIGNLKIGQAAQLKYFAYPFQEYGIQNGSISDISTRPSQNPGETSFYEIRVALASESIKSRNGVEKPLEIGLQGLAEIKTGEKRFIEILFAPASKFFKQQKEDDGAAASSGH
jgi:hemolysin D